MVERRFPRTIASLDGLFEFVDAFAAAQRLDDQARFDLRLVMEELFTNLVKYHPESAEPIEIRLERDGPSVRAVLEDFDVDPWDLTAAPPVDTTVPLEQRVPGGLGLHLVRQITDDLRYQYEDRHSTITLTKRVDP